MKTKNYRILEITNSLDVKHYKIQYKPTLRNFKYLSINEKFWTIIWSPIIILFRFIIRFTWLDIKDNIETYDEALKIVDEHISKDRDNENKEIETFLKNKIKSVKEIKNV